MTALAQDIDRLLCLVVARRRGSTGYRKWRMRRIHDFISHSRAQLERASEAAQNLGHGALYKAVQGTHSNGVLYISCPALPAGFIQIILSRASRYKKILTSVPSHKSLENLNSGSSFDTPISSQNAVP